MKIKSTIAAVFITGLVSSGVASAALLTEAGLFSTGFDASGNLLAVNAADAHYTVKDPASNTSSAIAIAANGAWTANNSSSQWIGSGTVQTGIYEYTTTFDFTNYDLSSLVFSAGHVWVDNDLVGIVINNNPAIIPSNAPAPVQAASFNPGYSILSDLTNNLNQFVQGSNSITFLVNNAGGPEGFRTLLQGEIGLLAIPEPTAAIALAGLLGAGTLFRRRKVMA